MSDELYKRYRPRTFAEVVGQPEAVAALRGMVAKKAVPHALLFSGPSGVGKTTLCRILKDELGCNSEWDFEEHDSATFRGIDTVRRVGKNAGLRPVRGKCRVFLFDECHQFSKDAQEGVLKLAEDTPKHCYLFFATTEPSKLIAALKNRLTEVRLKSVPPKAVLSELGRILKAEKAIVGAEVLDAIVAAADGSVRRAVVLLQQALAVADDDERLALVGTPEGTRTAAFDIARALIWQSKKWPELARMISAMDPGENWEGVRRLILKCAEGELLKGGKGSARAYLVVQAARDNWFDCGRAGLVASVYEVLTS